MSATKPSATRGDYATQQLIFAEEIRFSELISAFSVSLDITQGHPQGHSMRTALIGMRIAEQLQLSINDQSALFYALLLKDLGCSSNAAKMSYLFGADDHSVKRAIRLIDWTKPSDCIQHCWTHCETGGSAFSKLKKVASLVSMKPEKRNAISQIRCDRGAQIARMLLLPEATAVAIYNLDEHWNGNGSPQKLKGDEISLIGRICCLAQTVEVFFTNYGLSSAMEVALKRRGNWFDPDLVDVLLGFKNDGDFWASLRHQDLIEELRDYEPNDAILLADNACLDRVAEAFAMVVDAKSPWTYRHSTRVAEIAGGIANELGCTPDVKTDIRRAALVHDIGKLGVSNAILDKPTRLTEDELSQMRLHTEYTHRILTQVDAFSMMADVAAAHHERLDGRGYHRGLESVEIHPISRILTVADVCEAMTAKRPYRDEMRWEQVREIMAKDVSSAFDADCFTALCDWYERKEQPSRVEDQLAKVEGLVSEIQS